MADPRPGEVAVIGAGLMGHAIAKVFLTAGSQVRVWDADAGARDAVTSRIATILEPDELEALNRLDVATDLADAVGSADLVFEAIAEDLTAKQELMRSLDALAPKAIVATNTSVLRISEIAAKAKRPTRIVGAHWWNPAHLIAIVEVVPGAETSEQTVETVIGWLVAAGKTPVRVSVDAPGFIGNRMQFALWREALAIVEQGICDAATVDLVARETFGRRLAAIGPIENADLIGLPLTRAIMAYVLPHLSSATTPSRLIDDAIDSGRTGAVNGAGLLEWEVGALKETRHRLAQHLSGHRAGPED